MLKKLKKNKKGFTLAELLIVVAIIGVLVAISIPIFTSQLEKSREAVDEANLRSLYAETTAAVLTEDQNATTDIKDATLKVVKGNDNVYTGTATLKLTQQKDGLTSGDSVNIGGVDVKSEDWKKGGTLTITVKSDGTKTTISPATSTTGTGSGN